MEGSSIICSSSSIQNAFHPSGKVFIADSDNNRIQVLNPDLSNSHIFGSEENGLGPFDCQYDVPFPAKELHVPSEQRTLFRGKVFLLIKHHKEEKSGSMCEYEHGKKRECVKIMCWQLFCRQFLS